MLHLYRDGYYLSDKYCEIARIEPLRVGMLEVCRASTHCVHHVMNILVFDGLSVHCVYLPSPSIIFS